MQGHSQAGQSDTPDILSPELLRQWRTAEERLYPMVMVLPEGYERVVRLVGEATVELQLTCPDVASLVAAAPAVPGLVKRLADQQGFGDGLDLPLIAAAACLMRYRLLAVEIARQQRIDRIAAAVESGATWVVLDEGGPLTAWPPLPSTTVEMHLASGRALEQSIELDPASGAPAYTVSEVALDARTGSPLADQPSVAPVSGIDNADDWRAAIARRRRLIEEEH